MNFFKRIAAFLAFGIFILPFGYLLMLSFTEDYRFPQLLPSSFNNKGWREALFKNTGIPHGLFISLLIAFCEAMAATLLGFFISRAIAYHKRRNLLLFACYFPLAISPVILALLVNYYFIKVGLSGTIGGIICAQLLITLPYGVILLNSFWSAGVKSLEEVSGTLGANFLQTLFKVLVPVARSQLVVCFIQCFLISWFDYGLTSIIGVGQIKTLTLKVYQYINEADVYYAAISCCIIVLPIVILLWVNKKFIYHKII